MVDVLAIGAHPDDIEIFMGGTVGVLKQNGFKVAVCDLTRGEGGTYGNAELRKMEAEKAARILNLDYRETLDMPDGYLADNEENRLKLVEIIRKYQPQILFSFIDEPTRHPDHQMAGILARKCMFLAGLEKTVTVSQPHRPSMLFQFPELNPSRQPDLIIDISDFWQQKIESIQAYSSQVLLENKDDSDSKTFLRSQKFWKVLTARSVVAGAAINAAYGEPFFTSGPVRIGGNLKLF